MPKKTLVEWLAYYERFINAVDVVLEYGIEDHDCHCCRKHLEEEQSLAKSNLEYTKKQIAEGIE